jgi:hypothetical protein
MKRIAIICGGTAGLLLILGVVEALTNYKWSAGDQNAFFGNPKLLLNDGITVLIAAGFLALVAAATWIAARRKDRSDQHGS